MASTIDEITIQYEEEGVVIVKELDKCILSRGAWTTILFKYQDWSKSAQEYGPVKFSLRRYRKRGGVFQSQSKFTISSVDQAKQIIEALTAWL